MTNAVNAPDTSKVSAPRVWSVTAHNLPEHATNRIHTDEGARERGFPAALVAGVTTYAYLTHAVVDRQGLEWVTGGGASVRFLAPVFAGDMLRFPVVSAPGTDVVSAQADGRGVCATMQAWVRGDAVESSMTEPHDHLIGEPLPVLRFEMTAEWADYGQRAGDDHTIYTKQGIVHPAVWPALANQTTHAHVVRGSWVHTNSLIRHLGACSRGAVVRVEAEVVRRWSTSRGERAALAVRIVDDANDMPIATLRHEALVALA